MNIGNRIREIRIAKNLSQGDIEQRTGLLRCYLSRVENSHTVPSIETLEKIARALDLRTYQLLYDGEQPPAANQSSGNTDELWGNKGKSARYVRKLAQSLSLLGSRDLKLLLAMAAGMARSKHGKIESNSTP